MFFENVPEKPGIPLFPMKNINFNIIANQCKYHFNIQCQGNIIGDRGPGSFKQAI
jgi:hypothetical protein